MDIDSVDVEKVGVRAQTKPVFEPRIVGGLLGFARWKLRPLLGPHSKQNTAVGGASS